jgi:hypothetical protein
MAVTTVVTARPGEYSTGGDGRRQGRARVSIWGKIRIERGEWRTPSHFIRPPEFAGGQQRQRRPRDVAHLIAVASSYVSSRRDEDDDVLFVFIHSEEVRGLPGPCWAGADGRLTGLW